MTTRAQKEKAHKYLQVVSDYMEANPHDITVSFKQLILNAYNAGYSEGKRTADIRAAEVINGLLKKSCKPPEIEWIDVDDDLPQTWKDTQEWLVVVEDVGGNRFIGTSRFTYEGWMSYDHAAFLKITHWAEAPEWMMPKGEK